MKAAADGRDCTQELARENLHLGERKNPDHINYTGAKNGKANLGEGRAKAVKDYLVQKSIDSKLLFWVGKDAKEPVPVTKCCNT